MIVSNRVVPQFSAFADNVAFAQNKQHISIFNGSTDKIIRLRRLYAVNLQLAAVTGVACRFDFKRITALDGTGTIISPGAYESPDLAILDAGIKVSSGGGATEAASIAFAFALNNDEVPVTNSAVQPFQRTNILTSDDTLKAGMLLPGEGFTVKQITNTIVGTYGWIMMFTQETKL